MKCCEKCKKAFSDNQVFCTECGGRLNVSEANVANTGNMEQKKNVSTNIWLPVILAAAGAVIGWFLSGLFGLILGVSGVSMMLQQKKQGQAEPLPTVLTWVLGVAAVIFWIMVTMA